MRIEYKIEGGVAYFPGLRKPVVIDSEDLTEEEGTELERLIDKADFFDLPGLVGTIPQGAADYRQYIVTVENGKRRHTVRLTDPIENADLQALLNYLNTKKRQGGGLQSPPK